MDDLKQQFYLETYERLYQRGVDAHRKDDFAAARRDLLKASEMLYKLAGLTNGSLRRTRTEKAAKLLTLAKAIDPQTPPATEHAPSAPPATTADDEQTAHSASFLVASVPDVSLEDVAGLEEVKAVIRKRVIYPFQHPEVTQRYKKQIGGGVLLYGPPGTGKTMIAKAIANEVDAAFFSIKCSDIMSKWVGEAEKNLNRLFQAAGEHPRAVIFMDETEAIVAKRGGDSTIMNRVIPEFLAQVDGVQGRHGGLLLLGATNRPWDMDQAALRPGRFGELIYVALPDTVARHQILADTLAGIPLAENVNLMELADQTDSLSGADLVALCEFAKDAPYEREITTGQPQRLEREDLEQAQRQFRPSVSNAQLLRYQRFRDQR